MQPWLAPALDYLPRWIEFQMRQSEQPGCTIAVAHNGQILLEQAFGHADLCTGARLQASHRFRVASHSKTFTTSGILKLREQGKLQLDDRAGKFVSGLHPGIAQATIAQLLSHSAGVIRDGQDTGFWADREPFPDHQRLLADLAGPPILQANTRFKYSNYGFGLAGMIIEAITDEPYIPWMRREIVEPFGLADTEPDISPETTARLARGHSLKLPLGHRVIFPGESSTGALASATGFVSTAGDLVKFFSQLSPDALKSPLSAESRREMVRRQWKDPHSPFERWYGLGTISGDTDGWSLFGHAGGFQGYITRTAVAPEHDVAISVLTNAADGLAHPWLDGIVHILARFAEGGAPDRELQHWTGRWWSVWRVHDLLPIGKRVLLANPTFFKPLEKVAEIEVQEHDAGRIALAGGFDSHGEPARLVRDPSGVVTEVWVGGTKLVPEASLAEELQTKYRLTARSG